MPGEFYMEGKLEKVNLDALSSRIGTNTDLSGTATLFARLKQIVDDYLASGTIGLSALKALIDDLGTRLDKLAGENPASGSVTGSWNSGTATSGETGADVIAIGADNTRKKLHSLLLNVSDFQAGARITVKMFTQINGTERKVYEQEFRRGNDPDGLWIVNGTVGIHEALRVEARSNKAADDGVSMDYDYLLEAMQ